VTEATCRLESPRDRQNLGHRHEARPPGLEIIVFGAGYLVREALERWRNRHPESPVEWREQDGYR
jgi:hypothetical protein